ncbi:hypothetical protein LCGC14_1408060, partial [marine sediment metagenome]
AFGIYEMGNAGWNMLLDKVLKKPGDLNKLGETLTRAGLNRNLNVLERQRGIKIPPPTRKAFIDKYLSEMASAWERAVGGQGKAVNIQSLQIASRNTYTQTASAVNREIQALIPKATQTGAMVMGGVPEVTVQSVVAKITSNQALTTAERQLYANQAQAIEAALKAQQVTPTPTTEAVVTPPAVTPEALVTPEVSKAIETFLATPNEQILRATNEIRSALEARGFSRDFIDKMSFPEMKQALRQPIPKAVTEVTKPPAVTPPVTPEVSKVFDITTTDMSGYDEFLTPDKMVGNRTLKQYLAEEKDIQGSIVWMTPDEYMAKSVDIHDSTLERELRSVSPKVIDKFVEQMRAGEKFPLPVLDYKRSTQEGRQRVLAAKQIGETNVPVLVVEEVAPQPPAVTKPPTEVAPETPQAITKPVKEEVSAIPPTEVIKPPVKPKVVPKVAPPAEPVIPPTEPIARGVVSGTQGMKDLGAKEKVRPARKVLTRIGQWRGLFKPTQKAEVELHEEQVAKSKMFDGWQKLLGKDKARWALVSDEINKKGSVVGLTPEENRVVDQYRKWADEWANRKDLPQTKRIKDYMPHLFEQEATRQIKEEGGIDPVLAQLLSEKATRKITDPFLKKRLGTVGWIKDPVAAARAYEAVSLKFAYYTPLLNKIDTMLADPSIPQSTKNYLSGYSKRMTGELSEIDKSANITIREFAEKIKNVPGIGKFLYPRMTQGNPMGMASYHLTGGLYGLFLGFKATSAIRNLSQHTLILGEVGPKHFSNGIKLRTTSEGRAAMKKSLVLRSRKFAYTAGLDSSFASRWTDKFRETALYMFRLADRQNVSDAFLAGYSEAKEFYPEASEQVWIDRGDEVAADTQYLYTKMNSMSFSQSAPGRTMSMLTTWTENWMELMTKWIKRTPSQVYLEQERLTGKAIPTKNWSQTYKAIGLYMVLVGLAFAFDNQTRLKIKEYTGIGSLRYLAGAVGGEFPAMEAVGSVANMIAGFLTDDERLLNSGLAEFKSTFTPGVIRQLGNVGSGEKDWSTLLFYLEAKNFQIKNLKDKWEKDWQEYPTFETPEDKTEYMKTHPKHRGWSDAKIRNQWREDNPRLEAQMFVVGQFTTLSSDKARSEVLRLIEEHNLDTEVISGYEKVFGIDTKVELKIFEDRIGNLEDLVAGEEPKYFTMGNYVSEVNKLVNSVGRSKVQKEASPLTRGILEAQDTIEGYEVLEEGDARTLWRRQYPEGEAWMCLMGQVQSPTSLKSAEILQGLVEKYNIPLNIIPAFQLTDKGKERIPSNRDLWGHYFFYYDLPGTSYLNMTQGQVDSGQLPEKYRGEWETYQKLKTDTAKSAFRKGHREAAYGNWRDDFRRDNPEFDQWLQDEKDMKPLTGTAPIRRARAGATSIKLAGAGGGFGGATVSPRGAAPTYP